MKKTILSIMLAALTMGAVAQNTDSIRVKNDTTGTKKKIFGDFSSVPWRAESADAIS